MKNEVLFTILNDNPCDMFDDMEKSGTFEELKKINEWDFDLTDDKKWELVDDEIYYNYDSERKNLSCVLDGKIMVIADLGLWNGRRSGYKYLTENLNSIFDVGEDYNEWYVDDLGDIRCKAVHHDGTNYYLFRAVKPDMNMEILEDKLYEGTATRRDITRYTERLGDYVGKIYGCKIPRQRDVKIYR